MSRTKRFRNYDARKLFTAARRAEVQYGVKLRKIASHIGELVNAFADPLAQSSEIARTLEAYANAILPYARATSARMLADVQARDKQLWTKLAHEMSTALREELLTAPTGQVLHNLQASQVQLITSLPLEAAQRVHSLAEESLLQGRRSDDIVEMIRQSGQVSKARANVIARTETSRVSANLLQARAEHVGSEGYIWHDSEDSIVRPSHRRMRGKFVYWAHPPTLDNLTGHAGCLPNCRCFSEPVLPD